MQHLRYPVEVRNHHPLQNDTHVRSKEQLDVHCLLPTRVPLVNQDHLSSKPLEVNQHQEDSYRSCQLG